MARNPGDERPGPALPAHQPTILNNPAASPQTSAAPGAARHQVTKEMPVLVAAVRREFAQRLAEDEAAQSTATPTPALRRWSSGEVLLDPRGHIGVEMAQASTIRSSR